MRQALRWVAALLLGCAAVMSTSTTSHAAACPALDYQTGLAAAAAALNQAPPDITGAQRQVSALAAAYPGSAVALRPVIADLATIPANENDVEDAQLRLTSMSATLAYPRGSVCNENAAAAHSALRSVYASPDFRHLDDTNQPGLLQTIVNAIATLLGRGAGALGPVGAALLGGLVLAACLLLAWRRWHGSAAVRGTDVEELATAGDDPEAEWRAAQRAAAAGEYREAVRRAFRSALLEVAVRGRVDIDAAWTTRELLQRIDAAGDVLVALAAAAALFERAWYSGVAVTRDDWTLAEERCASVRRLAREAGVTAR
ncbi:MAG: DUF4129 domain-containing protein [Candidatus Dormibacteraeota bacterium]|nr:DUF4129 domain-containing protein [Candidatus Dormibacteraeota bacterium]